MTHASAPRAASNVRRLLVSVVSRLAQSGAFAPTLTSFIRNPYRYFGWARAISPVLWVNLLGVKGWLVTGFDEADAILRDPRFIKDRSTVTPADQLPRMPAGVAPAYRAIHRMLGFLDAPDHTRIRRLVTRAFTPAMVASLRAEVEAACEELIARRIGATEHELVADFASPIPLRGITALLGVPVADAGRLRRWSEQFVHLIDLQSSTQHWVDAGPGIVEFEQYLHALIAQKRSAPGDDLISGLIAGGDGGERLTDDEMVSTCMLLLIAGHDTTANLIATGCYRLLQHPAQYRLLQANPALLAPAIEEMLRYDPPLMLTNRWVSTDLTCAGRSMKQGQVVLLSLAAANRDPRVVKNPDLFDVTRPPNRHLAFAAGAHYCLGSLLGKMEAEVALRMLLARFDRPVLLEEPRWRQSTVTRGFESLRLRAIVS